MGGIIPRSGRGNPVEAGLGVDAMCVVLLISEVIFCPEGPLVKPLPGSKWALPLHGSLHTVGA